jgi:tetratricopeptide (TPR) repeat protein
VPACPPGRPAPAQPKPRQQRRPRSQTCPDAAQALQEALSLYRDLGDQIGEAEALNEAGALHMFRGDLSAAETRHRQALDLASEMDLPWGEAHALAGLGRCALSAGRAADAEADLRKARDIFQQIGAAEASGISAELDALTNPGPSTHKQ